MTPSTALDVRTAAGSKTNGGLGTPAASPWQCPVCGTRGERALLELPSVPVHCNILWDTNAQARRAKSALMRLALCDSCGLLFNSAFDPGLLTYDETYENSLHASPHFQRYADDLVRHLSHRYALRDRTVVEIGCGKGEFLRLLCRASGAHGIGIDASYEPALWPEVAGERVRFVREPFSAIPADLRPALVYCRHVLEHIPQPDAFVREMVAGARRSGGAVFVEVPDATFTLRDRGVWDLIYEHCLYFTAPALAHLFEREGLGVARTRSVYGGQYLCLEGGGTARVAPPDRGLHIGALVRMGDALARHYAAETSRWADRLAALAAAGRRVAVWGAGSKGVTFVNVVPGADTIDCLIDLNPRKRGRFVPGTGHRVLMPADVAAAAPDVILVMNQLYRDEIAAQARAAGLNSAIEIVSGPG